MNKLYKLFLIISLFSFLYTLSVIMLEVVEMTIPNLKAAFEVEEWDKNKNTADVYAGIKKYAQENNVDIHKIVFATDEDGSQIKKIFTFARSNVSDYVYDDHTFDSKVYFYDSSELNAENILGSYALTSGPPDNLEKEFSDLGLSVKMEKFHISYFMIGGLFTTIGILSFVLLCTAIISCFVRKATQIKKYGIWEIHGKRLIFLGLKDFFYDSVIIFVVFAIFIFFHPILAYEYVCMGLYFEIFFFLLNILGTALVNKQQTIVDKIKGKKPYQLYFFVSIVLKLAVLIFFVTTFHETIQQVKESKEMLQGLSVWEKIDDYYQLYFSNATTLLPPFKTVEEGYENAKKRMLPLLENAENNQGILAIKGEMQSVLLLPDTESHSFMTVNTNFLDVVSVLDEDGSRVKDLSDNKFYCLIPESYKSDETNIINEVRSRIHFYQDIRGDADENYEGELEIIHIKSNQKIFNFNAEDPQNCFSDNPIMIVVYLQGINSEIIHLLAEMSQGNYLFHDLEATNHYLQENGLENEFYGLISVKSSGLKMLQNVKQAYRIKIMTLVFLSVIFIIIEFFISYSHIELKKKKIFLQYIFGKSFWCRHGYYFKDSLLISMAVMLCMFFLQDRYWHIIIGVILFEIVLLLFTITIAESLMRSSILKKEE